MGETVVVEHLETKKYALPYLCLLYLVSALVRLLLAKAIGNNAVFSEASTQWRPQTVPCM